MKKHIERFYLQRFRLVLIAAMLFAAPQLYCVEFFTGYAGGMSLFDTAEDSLAMRFQAFFAGQFNFTQDIIGRLEFSIKTDDLIEENIFKSTSARFKLDELSVLHKKDYSSFSNYLSAFVGTYEPIGSDIFLRRHFGIAPIASKVTESWLGLSGSIACPLFGAGLSEVVQFASPVALGVYAYVNMDGYLPMEEDSQGVLRDAEDLYAMNFDLRAAWAFQYFTCDLAAGLCIPFEDDDRDVDDDALIVIKRLTMHCGVDLLLGNNSTLFSLFVQAGFHRLTFTRNDFDKGENIYLLFEPRFHSGIAHIDFTFFNFPQDSADNFLLIDGDRLGANLAVYSDAVYIGGKAFEMGAHCTVSTINDVFSIIDDSDLYDSDDLHVTFSPYLSTRLFAGDLRAMLRLRFTDFVHSNPEDAVRLYVGYKTQL